MIDLTRLLRRPTKKEPTMTEPTVSALNEREAGQLDALAAAFAAGNAAIVRVIDEQGREQAALVITYTEPDGATLLAPVAMLLDEAAMFRLTPPADTELVKREGDDAANLVPRTALDDEAANLPTNHRGPSGQLHPGGCDGCAFCSAPPSTGRSKGPHVHLGGPRRVESGDYPALVAKEADTELVKREGDDAAAHLGKKGTTHPGSIGKCKVCSPPGSPRRVEAGDYPALLAKEADWTPEELS